MTYNIHRCQGRDGRTDPGRILEVIREVAPDVVALQDVNSDDDQNQLKYLAGQLGMASFGLGQSGGNGFLSYYPLKGVQEYALDGGGYCLRADLDIAGKRTHLYNLRFNPTLLYRRRQVRCLLGPDLLGNKSLGCPVLIVGDFADFFGILGDFLLPSSLRRAPEPFWSATYPACFPVFSRDRGYLRDGLQIDQSWVHWGKPAREASTHLPMIYTVRIKDTRRYLPIEKLKGRWIEVVSG